MSKYKYSVLMYNFNNYEIMREIKNKQFDVEYIMVTDNKNTTSNTWTIKYIPELNNLPIWERCWTVRYNVFNYVESDICLYLDAAHVINDAEYLTKYIDYFIANNYDFSTCVHPQRYLMLDELNAWKNRFMAESNISENYFTPLYNWIYNNYDINYKGQYQTNIMILRKNKDFVSKEVYNLMKKFKEENNLNDFYRVEQPIYTALLNTKYLNMKILPLSSFTYLNSNLCRCFHNSNKIAFNTEYVYMNYAYFKNELITPFFIE